MMNASLENAMFSQPQNPVYEPSYRMHPKEGEKFLKADVEREMKTILQDKLKDITYDPKQVQQINNELCNAILEKVKTMKYPRYKFVVQVMITSASGQCIRVASRCLWDPHQDNYASVSYKNVSYC